MPESELTQLCRERMWGEAKFRIQTNPEEVASQCADGATSFLMAVRKGAPLDILKKLYEASKCVPKGVKGHNYNCKVLLQLF